MDGSAQSFNWLLFQANGNVRPSRVVTGVTGAGNGGLCVEASVAGTIPGLGISGEWTRFPGGSPADDGYHAIATEPCTVHGPGSKVNAVAGAAITDTRLPLTFDNQGRVVTATVGTGGTDTWCIAWPTRTAVGAGEKIEVIVVQPFTWNKSAA